MKLNVNLLINEQKISSLQNFSLRTTAKKHAI